MTRELRFAAVLAALSAARPAAATPAGDLVQIEILAETLQQGLTMSSQLATLRQAVTDARENISFMRSMYGLVSDFKNFDPGQFMTEAKNYFLAQNREIGDASALVADLRRYGLKGRFNASAINRRIRDANLYLEANTGYRVIPYDFKRALGIGQDVDDLLASPTFRQQEMSAAMPVSATSGLIEVELMQADGDAWAAALHQRAIARENAVQAMQIYAESLGASPGKSQQLAAQAAGITAAGVSQLSETSTRALALQEQDRVERSQAAAQGRREADALWRGITDGIDSSFRPVPRRTDTQP